MKIYLAGPMSGLPEFNYPAFNHTAKLFRDKGHEVLNPAENFSGDTSLPYPTYCGAAMKQTLEADAIVLLHGWFYSFGAQLELLVALAAGKKVYEFDFYGTLSPEWTPSERQWRMDSLAKGVKRSVIRESEADWRPPENIRQIDYSYTGSSN